MDLDVTVGGEYGRDGVGVLLVNRRDGLIQIRFRHTRDAHHQRPDDLFRNQPFQARQALAREHGLELVRRPG